MPSTFCVLSNGDLRFLPYRHSNATDLSVTRRDVEEVGTVRQASPPVNGIHTSTASLPDKSSNFPVYTSIAARKVADASNSLATPLSLVSNASTSTLTVDSGSYSETENTSQSPMVSQIIQKYCAHAIYLPDRFIEPSTNGNQLSQVGDMLFEIFPEWQAEKHLLKMHEMTGGITNMLMQCTYTGVDPGNSPKTVLVRTYGRGTGLIIDRDREFVSHLVLSSFKLAPQVYARFGNGLVYGFIEGRALKFEEMSHPQLYPLIASELGRWHRMVDVHIIEDSLAKLRKQFATSTVIPDHSRSPSDIWLLIRNWIDILPEIPAMVKVCDQNKDIQEKGADGDNSLRSLLYRELEWVQSKIADRSPTVAAHSDLLSGNIILPTALAESLGDDTKLSAVISESRANGDNAISIIDYEYMMPGPRAFDISNHFQEWQGFKCDKSLIPAPQRTNQLMRTWCKSYLSTYNDEETVTCAQIDALIDEIHLYYGLPGFYWGIWAGIQSTISLIDFDYGGYSGERLVEYWTWKREYLEQS